MFPVVPLVWQGTAAGTTGQSCASSKDASTVEDTKAGQGFSPPSDTMWGHHWFLYFHSRLLIGVFRWICNFIIPGLGSNVRTRTQRVLGYGAT